MELIMADIKRYDPFGASLDDLFKGFFVRPVRFDPEMPQLQIRMDVKQDEKAYTVSAELPGVKKDDIHVAVDGNVVTISGEVRRETEEKKGEQKDEVKPEPQVEERLKALDEEVERRERSER